MASSRLPPKKSTFFFYWGLQDGSRTPMHHSSHPQVTATALSGKSRQRVPITQVTVSHQVTAAPDCLDSVLPCPHGILAQNSLPQPQSQMNAVTTPLKGTRNTFKRAKPTPCYTQFKAKTRTPVPHPPTGPHHWNLALLMLGSNLPS